MQARFIIAALWALLLAVAAQAGTSNTSGGDQHRPPNILLLIADDQRWDQLGLVQQEQGNRGRFPYLKTPHLDALAAQGIRFRNAFVTTSLCSPSRAAILTGQYNHTNRIIDNLTPFSAEQSWASLLSQAGYTTAQIGKWHHGEQLDRPGFDFYATYRGQGHYRNTRFYVNNQWLGLPRPGYVDEVSVDFALDFMRDHADEPFAMMVGFKAVHGPFEPMEEHVGIYRDQTVQEVPNLNLLPPWSNFRYPLPPWHRAKQKRFWPKILETATGLDQNVGRLLEGLEQLDIADDTLVIFTSDNGFYFLEHNLGDKRSAYEESMRVPFIVRMPGLVPAGEISDQMVLNIDIAATILDIAGQPVPDSIQGKSLRPLLKAPDTALRDAFLYEHWQLPVSKNAFKTKRILQILNTPTILAVRTDTHKLITYPEHRNRTELFDLVNDPYETRNLARNPHHFDTLARLCQRRGELVRETGYVYQPPVNRWRVDLPRADISGQSYAEIMRDSYRPPLRRPAC